MAGSVEVINQLSEIFRVRQFAGLTGESPNFPLFITKDDSDSTFEHYNPRDAAFDLLLKLVLRAVLDLRKAPVESNPSKQIRRLLSMVVPVGTAQFSRDNPPIDDDLSRLYNRYSSVLLAFRLDPTTKTMRSRIQQAQRYSDFKIADWKSRQATIRAMMYFAIGVVKAGLELKDTIEWLSAINGSLLADFKQAECALKIDPIDPRAKEQRSQILIAVQLSLGAIRFVLQSFGSSSQYANTYPDSSFLQAEWLVQIFQTSMLEDRGTSEEIRRFIQAFLSARLGAVPRPSRPSVATQPESQDEFGEFDLDMDDPDVIALMEGRATVPHPYEAQDKQVAEIIRDVVSPAIYRIITRGFLASEVGVEDNYSKLDPWIDCWAGCGHVLVQNKLRDWSHYFLMGAESWTRIIEGAGRRHAGIRFMLTILELDPMAYKTHKDAFIEIWLVSVVAVHFTVEHLFTSRMLSLDGLRHPLLLRLPIARQDEKSDFDLSKGI
ncbi:hypothetical protein BS47DRAFT_1298948 [Hydnum rufescens UP504]|uniref:Uncharacterized protein n=1 Tax=Hydnum rufescens UP504 TaxID=1448309 RepID=A0A9P6DQQ4_9AGAM|nr:hypothetical protein BS47DRAFT_1298948 [Hydnum rufescens UP504]